MARFLTAVNWTGTMTDKAIEGIWQTLCEVNNGEKSVYDTLPDNETTIGEMIEDLKLEFFIRAEILEF